MTPDAIALADAKRREAERARRLGQGLNEADRLLFLRLADDLDREADELERQAAARAAGTPDSPS